MVEPYFVLWHRRNPFLRISNQVLDSRFESQANLQKVLPMLRAYFLSGNELRSLMPLRRVFMNFYNESEIARIFKGQMFHTCYRQNEGLTPP